MVHNLMVRHPVFARFLENPVLHAYLSPLLGDTCILYAYTSSSMPPSGCELLAPCPRRLAARDSGVLDERRRDGRARRLHEENGATRFLPHSFERMEPPSVEEFLEKSEQTFPRAGEAVIFNARTWHMGGMNRTPPRAMRSRSTSAGRTCGSASTIRASWATETLDHVGEMGRRFLGFNVRMPATLDEYYLPEEERLYKAGQG